MRQTLARCSIHSPRASSSTFGLLSAGTAVKSNVSKSLWTGKSAARMRACTALLARAATSSSVSRSRYWSYPSFAAAASRASFSNSACIVGSRSCLRFALSSRWVLALLAIGLSSLRKQLVEPAQVGPRNLILTQRRHCRVTWRCPSVHGGAGAGVGQARRQRDDPVGVQRLVRQPALDGALHAPDWVLGEQLQDADVLPRAGAPAVPRLQRRAQPQEA